MALVWKLLRQHISIPQFVGFFFANLVGMLIILLGVQFYTDTQSVYTSEDSFMKEDYLIINKEVNTIGSIVGSSTSFSKSEIEELQQQPFVEKLGAFTASSFDVYAGFDIEGFVRFSTDMFFESVPDEFVDVHAGEWDYTEGDQKIPIILPRNYLDLYNFGYAQSRNMPTLSEGILGSIRLSIVIRGNGFRDNYEGRIVGFSNRLNTILVPQAFMQWANDYYSSGRQGEATRLILQVNNPTDENITRYLKEHNYLTDEDKLDASKTTFILRVIVGIVMGVGLIISVLAFYILMLSVYLLVQKNSSKLGYSPARVSMPYQILTIGLNVLVFVLAFVVLIIIRQQYLGLFETFFPNMETPSLLIAVVVGVGLLLLVSVLNVIAVRSKVVSIWKRKD